MLLIDDKNPIAIGDFIKVARGGAQAGLTESAKRAVLASRGFVEKVLESSQVVYGISTGFGEFAKVTISEGDRERLQRNLILSHSVGVGDFFPPDAARGIMLLRVSSLARGYSGIRLSTVEKLLELLNRGVVPAVPAKGSVGASGDLAPLSHVAAVLLGEGHALENGKPVPAAGALARAGIKPIELAAKEGLALINGTQAMTSVAALVCHDGRQLAKLADIAAAMSLEALRGTLAAFDLRIAGIRPHPGQMETARNILRLTEGSEILASHRDCEKVQDAYSLRCASQVHGATRDALRRTEETVEIEMNSVTDNPIVMAGTGEIISGGNFHGQPVALAADYLKTALAEIANISERRLNRLVDPHLSGLPAFLTREGGVNSGFMIAQYTAASLVSENKVLAHPASADSIPTSANQEDHVSMGTIAARHAREVLENARHVLAIEMLAAAQGLDFVMEKGMAPGRGTRAAHRRIREAVPHLGEDRILSGDFGKALAMIADESLAAAVEEALGGELE